MKKRIVFSICMLLIALAVPTSIADTEDPVTPIDNVDIDISAGFHGKDIGLGISFDIFNHNTEEANVMFNITVDYLILNKMDFTYEFNLTVEPESPFLLYMTSFVCAPDGIKRISITAESGDTIVTRSGLSIRRLVILS